MTGINIKVNAVNVFVFLPFIVAAKFPVLHNLICIKGNLIKSVGKQATIAPLLFILLITRVDKCQT